MGIPVTYYESARGDQPVRDYIEALPDRERAKVKALIDHLSEKIVLNEPHTKKIGEGLFELRPGSHRVFYCYHEGKVVLLHAFRKKSNKTPQREIDTAYNRLNE